ncbi:MAG: FG-GAP-like repeat-containing protein [Gammaproteobacteria bacterium]|nr:FG-GAP-like repeat-containing protein [Gammaproteobacteria bacterium]
MRFNKILCGIAAPVVCLFVAPDAPADTIRVPADQPTIQLGIDTAVSGDNVLVSSGTYFERIDFSGKDIIVESESGAAATTINGSALGTVVTFSSGEPRTAVLRGFTITNGLATNGAGILIGASSPTIEDNIISGNVACEGAGIRVTGSTSSALIRRNTLTSNSKNACATGYGGGINVTQNANAEIRSNTFSLNSNSYGAGIHLENAGVVPITENEFFNNDAAAQGGAIAVFNGGDALIQQNLMYDNSAGEGGGIVFNVPMGGTAPTIASNTIVNNPISNITFGSGILAHGFPPLVVVRNNIVIATPGQSAIDCLVSGGTAMDIPDFRNNLVYSDGNLDFFGDCDGQSGMFGNLTGPATFANAAGADFRLQPSSSAIDSAEADATISLDFAGNTRTVDGDGDLLAELDMGAIEAQPPVADAGPDQSAETSTIVTLDASSSSDSDGVVSAYSWVQSSGTAVTLSDTQVARPSFTAPSNAGLLTFVVTVADDLAFSDADSIVVTVTGGPPPQPPAADAGPDQTIDASSFVALDGTGSSDSDGVIAAYAWAQTGGINVTLSSTQSASPTFTSPSSGGTLTFELTVTDNQGLTDSDTVQVVVTPPPVPPTANAGADRTVVANDIVSLDGSQSFDPDGSIAEYVWGQTSGVSVNLSDPQFASPSFTAPPVGDSLTFNLTVTDNDGLTDVDIVEITVVPFASSSDFDGDGKGDILWRNNVSGANFLYLMNGAAISSGASVTTVPAPDVWQVAGNNDYNGDGSADILWRNVVSGQNHMYLMNGSAVSSSISVTTVPAPEDWKVAGGGDYDGDGNSDILWRNISTGQNFMYLMNGAVVANASSVTTVSTDWIVAGGGDFDGDGNSDILWRNTVNGQNYMYLMNGATVASAANVTTVPSPDIWMVAGTGDFNGDGNTDILWRQNVTGQNHLYLMNGATVLASESVTTVPDPDEWKVAGNADYNGDGNADILWRNVSTGQNHMFLMNGSTLVSSLSVTPVSDTTWEIINTP